MEQYGSDALPMSAEEWQRCIGAEAGAVCGGQAARAHGHGAPEGAAAHAWRHAAAQHCPAGPARHADACPNAAVPGRQEAGQRPARQVSVPTTLSVISTWHAALLGSLPITALRTCRCSVMAQCRSASTALRQEAHSLPKKPSHLDCVHVGQAATCSSEPATLQRPR